MTESPTIPETSAQQLLAALSSVVGEPLELDAKGECGLEFTDGIEIVITAMRDPQQILVRAALTHHADFIETETLRTALAFNYAHLPAGHAMALDSASGQLALLAVLPLARVQEDEFLDLLAGFVVLVPQLRSDLATPATAAEAPDPDLLNTRA